MNSTKTIRVLATGRSYHATGALPDRLELPAEATVALALERLQQMLDAELPRSCLIAVSGQHLGTVSQFADQPLQDGDELTLISPVAGG